MTLDVLQNHKKNFKTLFFFPQALEEKYMAQKKINQSLEAHILNLQLALNEIKHEKMTQAAGKKTRASSQSKEEMPSGQEPSHSTSTGNIETSH